MTEVHDFDERLRESRRPEVREAFAWLYLQEWPGCRAAWLDDDLPAQLRGIDARVFPASGPAVAVKVEEKATRRDYGHFLCEVWHDLERRTLGWTVDPAKDSDVVAWLTPTQLWLIPFPPLRAGCRDRLRRWRRERKWVESRWTRRGAPPRTTRSFEVPWEEVAEIVGRPVAAMRRWRPATAEPLREAGRRAFGLRYDARGVVEEEGEP